MLRLQIFHLVIFVDSRNFGLKTKSTKSKVYWNWNCCIPKFTEHEKFVHLFNSFKFLVTLIQIVSIIFQFTCSGRVSGARHLHLLPPHLRCGGGGVEGSSVGKKEGVFGFGGGPPWDGSAASGAEDRRGRAAWETSAEDLCWRAREENAGERESGASERGERRGWAREEDDGPQSLSQKFEGFFFAYLPSRHLIWHRGVLCLCLLSIICMDM